MRDLFESSLSLSLPLHVASILNPNSFDSNLNSCWTVKPGLRDHLSLVTSIYLTEWSEIYGTNLLNWTWFYRLSCLWKTAFSCTKVWLVGAGLTVVLNIVFSWPLHSVCSLLPPACTHTRLPPTPIHHLTVWCRCVAAWLPWFPRAVCPHPLCPVPSCKTGLLLFRQDWVFPLPLSM